ncbi:hypothetical protein B296_00004698, partial [Ensete ventricosum]
VVFPTLWVKNYKEYASEEGLRANLDLLEEQRAEAHLQALVYKKVVVKLYNQNVHPRQVNVDDLALRKAEIRYTTHTRGKLMSNWEGPHRVTSIVRDKTY